MASRNEYESLTNMELRQKLLEFKVDLPVSVKKDFMIKTLERVIVEAEAAAEAERRKAQLIGRRSLPVMSSNSRSAGGGSSNNHNQFETNSNSSSHSRQSTGSRASVPKQTQPLQPRTRVNDQIPEDMEQDYDEDEEEVEEDEEEMEESSPEPSPQKSNIRSPTTGRSSLGYSTNAHSFSSRSPVQPQRYDQEEDEDEEEENRTPSPRYQKYLSYFKGDSKAADPFVMPRSQYGSPIGGSPYSTIANVGSRNQSFDFDDSADESENEHHARMLPLNTYQSRMRTIFGKVNPVNWIPNPKAWLFSTAAKQETDQNYRNQLNFNFGSGSGGTSSGGSTSPSTPTSARYSTGGSGGVNGHNFGRANLANQIYSPAQPPPPVAVPPAMAAAGRQAGFKAFFSRGERNGYGYPAPGSGSPADSSHLIPKVLLVCFLVAVVGVLGAYYYKASIQPGLPGPGDGEDGDLSAFFGEGTHDLESKSPAPPPKKPKRTPTQLNYPTCGQTGYETEPCLEQNLIRDSVKLFEALRVELTQRSQDKSCGGLVDDKISLLNAKEVLYRLVDLTKTEVDKAFGGMLMLVTENPTMGMRIQPNSNEITGGDVKIQDIPSLDYATAIISIEGVSSTFGCMVVGILLSILTNLGYFVFAAAICYALIKFIKYRRQRQVSEDEEVFKLIDTVVNLLQEHYEESRKVDQDQFIAVNHIRDQLFSPRDRKQKEALWNKVVAQISSNESRVRDEIQHISGEEFRVWRWLPSASPLSKRMSSAPSSPQGGGDATSGHHLYPNLASMDLDSSGASNPSSPSNSKWQGQAFEIFDGSPNSLAQTPTTCLKIRQMFDHTKDVGDYRIEQAILEKCSNAQILHIGIDRDRATREGCVYIRCLTKMDARSAYGSLHGWWFDGHLLSVKFLREDRYFTRFPDAKLRTIPLTLANIASSSPVVQPLSGQQGFNNSMNTIRGGSSSQGFGIGGTSPRARFSVGN